MNTNNHYKVWDKFVRVSHWSLVLAFIFSYFSAELKGPLHRYIGYIIFVIVVARVIWGFCGTKHARFNNFVRSPKKGVEYLFGLIKGKSTYYIGHNPAAGWMIVLLLVFSLLTCASGYLTCSSSNDRAGVIGHFYVVKSAYADWDEITGKKQGKYKKSAQKDTYH